MNSFFSLTPVRKSACNTDMTSGRLVAARSLVRRCGCSCFRLGRFAPSVTMAVVIASVSCEDPQPPGACASIPEQTVHVGETKSVTACFEDPNDDMLVYAVATNDPDVAAAAVSGSMVEVKGMAPGGALVTVTATDVSGLTAELPFRVVVPNRAPMAVGTISALEVSAGESTTVEVSGNFLEPDGESLEYAATASDTATATVSGAGSTFTLAARVHGTATVTVKATDPGGLTATQSFLVTVPNRTPVVVESMPAETVQVGETMTHGLASHFNDPDGDSLAYSATVSDGSLAEVSVSLDVLSVTAIARGRTQVTVVATDAEGLTAAFTFDVTVPNRAPQAIGAIPLATVPAGETTTVDARPYFDDPDGDVLLYAAAISDSSVAMVSVEGGTVTVAALGKGDAMVTVTGTDAEGLNAVQQFVVTVPNRAPVAQDAIAALTLEAGETLGLPMSPHFDDPDGDSLVFAAGASDSAVVAVSVFGSSVEVTALGKGEATVAVTVLDTEGLTAGQSFVVTVPNRMPVVVESMPAEIVQVGETTTHDLASYFSDPDGDPLAYSATVSDTALAEVSVSEDILSVTVLAKGRTQVTVVATDEGGLTAALAFAVTGPNRGPQAIGAIPLATVPAGETTTVDARAYFNDPDGDVLLYAAVISDATVATVSVAGSTVTVTALEKGDAMVTVTAADAEGLAAVQQFDVTVPNRAPVAKDAITPLTLEAGETLGLPMSPHFDDPDGDSLVFAAGASDSAVVAVSAFGSSVEVTALGKGEAMVTVTVSDTEGLTAGQSFVVTVPNRMPVVVESMPAQTVQVGETTTHGLASYFSDPDGDPLAYSATVSDTTLAEVSVSEDILSVTPIAKGQTQVTVVATDEEGLAAALTFAVTGPNRGPRAIGAIPLATVPAGETTTVGARAYFNDPDGDVLLYAAVISDATVATVSVAGSTVTVAARGKGEATVTVTVTDDEGLVAMQQFDVTVPNRAPVAQDAIAALTLEAGETLGLPMSPHFDDPDGDSLVFAAGASDSAVVRVSVLGSSVEVTALGKGEAMVTVTVSDTEGLTAGQSFVVTVPNRMPVVVESMPAQTVQVGETTTHGLASYFSDPDGDPLAYSATVSDTTLAEVSVSEDILSVTPIAKGQTQVTVVATDEEGLAASLTFDVTGPNRGPRAIGAIPPATVSAEETTTVDASGYFDEPDGDVLLYAAVISDATVATVSVAGSTVTVTALEKGDAMVTVTAADAEGLAAVQQFVVTVPNRAPVALDPFPSIQFRKGAVKRVDPTSGFADPDNDPLVLEVASSDIRVAKTWVSADKVLVRGVNKGTATITVTARDPEGEAANQTFAVTVIKSGQSDPNRPPVAVGTIPARTLQEGESSTLSASSYFSDPDNDHLNFTAASSNAGVVEAAATGAAVEMQARAEGTATVTITARDSEGLSANQTFAVGVTVPGANRAPVRVGAIPAQTLGEDDSKTLNAASYFSDPDGDDLEFAASSSNTDVVVATATGAAVEMQAGDEGTATVTITARDPEGLTANQIFRVGVEESGGSDGNSAPTRIGSMYQQTMGEGDSMTLIASDYFSDPDEDDLNFEAASSDTSVVAATATGAEVEIGAQAEGTATVTITARDPEGLSADLEFDVAVEPPSPPISICSRTPAIRDEILSLTGAGDCATMTTAQLSSIGTLDLNNAGITALSSGDFAGLSGLWRLELAGNQLTALPSDVFSGLFYLAALDLSDNSLGTLPSGVFADPTGMSDLLLNGNSLGELPDGVFHHLTLLRTLWLHGNDVDPMPIEVSLESPADGTVKATVPSGAPFDIVIPIVVSNGTMAGDGTITIPIAHIESPAFEVSPLSNSQTSVTVDVGTLPDPPTTTSYTNSAGVTLPAHNGYTLQKSADLPLTVTVGQQEQQQPLPMAFLALPLTRTSQVGRVTGPSLRPRAGPAARVGFPASACPALAPGVALRGSVFRTWPSPATTRPPDPHPPAGPD